MGAKEVFELLGIILTIVCILVLAYLFTRYTAKFKMGGAKVSRSSNGHMKILDQLVIGQDTRLILVQTGQRFLLLGVSAAGLSLLSELSEADAALWLADLELEQTSGAQNPSFRDSFVESLKRWRK